MRRSEMVQDIASDLIIKYDHRIPFDEAQEIAEVALCSVEKAIMCPQWTSEEEIENEK